jgi:deaminated glutathione amidase
MTGVRIAVAQMRTGIEVDTNADALVAAVHKAKAGGAAMLFTPEMSGLLDRDRKRAANNIVCEADDRVLAAVCNATREAGIWVALGSLALRRDDSAKYANRSFVIDDKGCICARYDKLHLFDVDLPTGESWRESAAYAAGDAVSNVATPAGKLGLSVCYDIRFPALYAALSGAGATILSVPAAFTVPTGRAHWHILLRARAIENACWVVASAQTGTHEDGRVTYGHSLVIDPWGQVVLDMGDDVGIGFAEIDLAAVETARARVPVIAHRRVIPHLPSEL